MVIQLGILIIAIRPLDLKSGSRFSQIMDKTHKLNQLLNFHFRKRLSPLGGTVRRCQYLANTG